MLNSVEELVDMLMTFCSVGNASHESGSPYDAHARTAALYAPSWHDASSWDGTWSDAPWSHASWPDDARTDAWTNAPAGNACCLLAEHVFWIYLTKKLVFFFLLFFSHYSVMTFVFDPHRLQKILPITSSSSPTCQRRRTNSCCPCSSTS